MTQPTPSFIHVLGFEFQQAVRALLRRPGFLTMAVLTLTLGTAANTAVFSLANWLIVRPIPGIANPADIVTLTMELEGTRPGMIFMSVADWRALAALPGFRSLAAAAETSLNVTLPSSVSRVSGAAVTSNYFDVLGQRMTRGRPFTAAEDVPGQSNVIIVSERYWRTTLGGRDDVIGSSIGVNGHPFTVVGVASRGFRGPDRVGRTDMWVPVASHAASMPARPATLLTGDHGLFFSMVGRRADGVSVDAVSAQARDLEARLEANTPKGGRYKNYGFVVREGVSIPVWQRDGLPQLFVLLAGLSLLLLLLACANLANLLFAQARARRAELAARQALGASRGRIVGQLLLEGGIIATLSGLVSLGTAFLLGRLMDGLVLAHNLPALSSVDLDWRVFGFAVGVSAVACLGATLAPAVFGSRVELAGLLAGIGRGSSGGGRGPRRVLMGLQVAVSVALLSVATLLVQSVRARYDVPLGYDAGQVLALSVEPDSQGYSVDQSHDYYRRVLGEVRQLPGVSHAGVAWVEPFRLIGAGNRLRSEGKTVSVDTNLVTDGFFHTLGTPFVSGRDFTPDESFIKGDNPRNLLILNESLARALFGTTDAAGRQVEAAFEKGRRFTVVGVVADTRTREVGAKPVAPTAYEPFSRTWGTIHVRLTAPVPQVLPRIREIARAADPALPIYDVELLSDAVDRHLAEPRLLARTTALFAVLAALVATLGLYGMLVRGVAERRRELSIRAALGAGPLHVVSLITREAILVAACGGVVGVAGAFWLSRTIESRLFGVTPHDPLAMTIGAALVVALALVATIAPIRHAFRVDVVKELR